MIIHNNLYEMDKLGVPADQSEEFICAGRL